MKRLPTYFISHGGGPWPWLEGDSRRRFDRLERSLAGIAAGIGEKPRAVLVISGHWEEERFTAMSAERPGMVYDFSGFPAHTYAVQYRAPGDPALARRVRQLLEGGGIPAALDPSARLGPRHLRAVRGDVPRCGRAGGAALAQGGPEPRRPSGRGPGAAAPAARLAHPREDHLIPIMVAVGAAGDEPAERVYHESDFMGGVTASSYRFGVAPPPRPATT